MGTAVKRTIPLPPKLAKEVEDISREERKPLSAATQKALWPATHYCCLTPISCGFYLLFLLGKMNESFGSVVCGRMDFFKHSF